MRTPLPRISPLAWEHPDDRAALEKLRGIPGFDGVVRQVAGAYGGKGVRNLFLGNAVRVGPAQRPALWQRYQEALAALDWPDARPDGTRPAPPELYVTRTPWMHAGAVGFEEPFVVLNADDLALLDGDEQRFLLAHELGHVMSGRLTYRTVAALLLTLGVSNLPLVVGVVLLPFQLALLDWYRKAELSADRAGLLGVQDARVAYRAFLKLAGGAAESDDRLDVDAFLEQAAATDTGGSGWNTVVKALNSALRDHPLHTLRAAELRRWAEGEGYVRILAGEYLRRDAHAEPTAEERREARAENAAREADARPEGSSDPIGDPLREAAATIRDSLGRARAAFDDVFKGG
jgi:Zn-dependent protease with chaperone function